MLIKVVTENAEQQLIDDLQKNHGKTVNASLMNCNFSSIVNIEYDQPSMPHAET